MLDCFKVVVGEQRSVNLILICTNFIQTPKKSKYCTLNKRTCENFSEFVAFATKQCSMKIPKD